MPLTLLAGGQACAVCVWGWGGRGLLPCFTTDHYPLPSQHTLHSSNPQNPQNPNPILTFPPMPLPPLYISHYHPFFIPHSLFPTFINPPFPTLHSPLFIPYSSFPPLHSPTFHSPLFIPPSSFPTLHSPLFIPTLMSYSSFPTLPHSSF